MRRVLLRVGPVQLLPAAFALVLAAVPWLTAPIRPVAVAGTLGLVLTSVAIASPWRWPATAAACLFLVDYTVALWVTGAAVDVAAATAFGLALLFLLEAAELGRISRRATVGAGVVRAQLVRWLGFSAAALAAALVVTVLAGAAAVSIPYAVAPIVAALGALGVVLALTVAIARSPRRSSPGPPDPASGS